MPVEQLRSTLAAIRAQIAELDDTDAGKRERLEALVAELEDAVDGAGHPDRHSSVVAKVQEAIETFEVEHPRATGLLNEIMVILGNMGI